MYKLSEVEKQRLIDEMLDFLFKEIGISAKVDNSRATLNTLMLLNTNFPLGDYFYSLQDKLLSYEAQKNMIIPQFDDGVKKLDFPYIKADMLVFFGNTVIRADTENCLENKMLLCAGVQINEKFYELLKQTGFNLQFDSPYIIEGYNLNCEYIAKIVLDNNISNLTTAVRQLAQFVKAENLNTLAVQLVDEKIKELFLTELKNQNVSAKIVFVLPTNI